MSAATKNAGKENKQDATTVRSRPWPLWVAACSAGTHRHRARRQTRTLILVVQVVYIEVGVVRPAASTAAAVNVATSEHIALAPSQGWVGADQQFTKPPCGPLPVRLWLALLCLLLRNWLWSGLLLRLGVILGLEVAGVRCPIAGRAVSWIHRRRAVDACGLKVLLPQAHPDRGALDEGRKPV